MDRSGWKGKTRERPAAQLTLAFELDTYAVKLHSSCSVLMLLRWWLSGDVYVSPLLALLSRQ